MYTKTEKKKEKCYIETRPLRCWRSDVAEPGVVSLATDTDTVAVEGDEDLFSFVTSALEEVELGVCPCNFTHVSPRALAKWSSTATNMLNTA
jgi:hypothetical protein